MITREKWYLIDEFSDCSKLATGTEVVIRPVVTSPVVTAMLLRPEVMNEVVPTPVVVTRRWLVTWLVVSGTYPVVISLVVRSPLVKGDVVIPVVIGSIFDSTVDIVTSFNPKGFQCQYELCTPAVRAVWMRVWSSVIIVVLRMSMAVPLSDISENSIGDIITPANPYVDNCRWIWVHVSFAEIPKGPLSSLVWAWTGQWKRETLAQW